MRSRLMKMRLEAKRFPMAGLLAILFLVCTACGNSSEVSASAPAQEGWISLFDGKTLGNWKITNFGGQGEVKVEDGAIILPFGQNLTGITWEASFPKVDYEISLEAERIAGSDFFCGLTFPVQQSFCTFIVGGWGGSLVGLSSIDDMDASENETTGGMVFEKGRWYHIRVKVTADRIVCSVDDKTVVDLSTKGKDLSVRPEVRLSRPLGIASWQTTAGIKDIRYRLLSP